MNQHSEDRVEEPALAPSAPPSAQILPFERPQSDLQRAIQMRAQETIDLTRDREREANKPAPLRWLIILLVAAIPVTLIFGAVDGFLRAFYKVSETYNAAPAPSSAQPESSPAEAPPASAEPGVVILQSYDKAPVVEAEPRGEAPTAEEQ